jgi:hypothetical protein
MLPIATHPTITIKMIEKALVIVHPKTLGTIGETIGETIDDRPQSGKIINNL